MRELRRLGVLGLVAPTFFTFAVQCQTDPGLRFAAAGNVDRYAQTQVQRGRSSEAVVEEGASPNLAAVDSCANLETLLRAQLATAVRNEIAYNLELSQSYVEEMQYWGNYGGYGCGGPLLGCAGAAGGADVMRDGDTPPPEGYSDYTTTNTQLSTVDEADWVKNDGSYVYVLTGGQLQIFASFPADQTYQLSSTPVDGRVREMFLAGDQMVVFSSVDRAGACQSYEGDLQGTSTQVSVYDLTDRAAPRLRRQLLADGDLVASRRIGDAVFSVIDSPSVFAGTLTTWAELDWYEITDYDAEAGRLEQQYAELLTTALAQIETAPLDELLPAVSDAHFDAEGNITYRDWALGDCTDFLVPEVGGGIGNLLTLSISLANDDLLGATTIAGGRGEVFASPTALYVAEPQYFGWYGGNMRTVLHGMRLGEPGAAPEYLGSTAVDGMVINQFAMDEHEGFLRVATTHGPLAPEGNSLFVVAPVNGSLNVIGAINGIAPSEDIRAVRFDGDRGFIVTFKKTDPLYALDLSEPSQPRISGELHIPGFSTYMHLMDDDHLLTIGYDADDQGSFAYFTGVLLQIFDVSDMSQPRLVHRRVIGTRGSSSDATNDHMAFTYFRERDLLAIPMGICEARGGDYWDARLTFSGLLVYRVTTQGGFVEFGRVSHERPRTYATYDEDYYYDDGCYSWWSDPNSAVKRSIMMADDDATFVFSLTERRLKVNDVEHLDEDLRTLTLASGGPGEPEYCYDPYYYY